jgi:hypothetical protein
LKEAELKQMYALAKNQINQTLNGVKQETSNDL